MRSVSSRELIRLLREHGWEEVAVRGSHHQFRHAHRPGRVTVPHPKKDLPSPTIRSILRQAGLDESEL
jgi:predicted RNA binding protein YcfA (HicA-like mRNA interferase family)